ncbi:unnamed protein product [Porites lobata]|uniref:Gelsolin-like domain-containing protein n=1 Tax=Porites lobata TaxID=104759 RepID=A0ABN8QCR0_9CNID|nr:unnamed protein product [Porites lobata]
MSRLVKQKEYDWKHSNIANIGSNQDILARKNAALCEPAWSETKKMQENGLKIWRIEKFEVKEWPEEKYGTFFSGDSYIILHTEKASPDSDVIFYDVHFWIGKHSTQDEYTTAAYKTVELDAYLDDKAVQHREVEAFESEAFKEYFVALGGIKIEEGGIESGFRHVDSNKQDTLIVHFKKLWNEEYERYTYEAMSPLDPRHLCCDDGFLVIFSGEDRIIQVTFY